MQSSISYARFSVSDGKWSGVSSNYGYAASGIASYWKERYQAAEKACVRLALGEKHPDIEKAIDDLSKYKGSTKATVTQLKKDYNEWLREVRKLRDFSSQDRDALREIMCKAGEYEMEAKVNEVADRWASQISGSYGTILGQADRLRTRASDDKLKKYKGAKEVLAGIETNLKSLENLKEYELKGSANPKVRARLDWGKKRHDELQGGLGCTYKEVAIKHCSNAIRPGSGCRADCMKVSGNTCKIIEIKPDSAGGKSEGPEQVRAYRLGLEEWHKQDRKDLLGDYPAVSACENDEKTALRVDAEVVYYDFCSGIVRDELGAVIKEISSDVSESE